jgi:zinc transport system ATP-binding protein
MNSVIDFENVSFGYGDNLILKDVSFSVAPGESVGIIGPNGGGKTTLLKLILGFLSANSGVIKVFGKAPQASLARIGYVPQALHFDKQFPISLYELVLTGRLAHLPWYGVYRKEDKDKALQAIAKVELSEFLHTPFGALSGGQAQRALIARALASDPAILLLDEPTANVDAKAEAYIFSLLKELQGHMTILMVTHDLSAAIEMVKRVFCVQHSVVDLLPHQVCQHFAFGLYHKPLIR